MMSETLNMPIGRANSCWRAMDVWLSRLPKSKRVAVIMDGKVLSAYESTHLSYPARMRRKLLRLANKHHFPRFVQ
jgi:hypothetical protein